MANNEKKLNLGDFFYVIKKSWLVECIILAVIVAAGVLIAAFTPRYYVAKTTVMIDMRFDETQTSSTAASLTKYYIPTVVDLITDDRILNDATNKHLNVKGEKCEASAVTAKANDDVLLINVSYKDKSADLAREKLVAVMESLKDYAEAKKPALNDDGTPKLDNDGNVIYVSANIQNIMKVRPMYSIATDETDENGETVYVPSVTVGSRKKTIVLLSVVLGVAAVFIYALCVYFIADKVSSVDRLETVSGLKNVGVIPKKKIDKKDVDPNKLVELDLTKVADALIYDHICTGRQIYQIQSSTKNEGKTSISINLAKELARANRKTVIIDCDFSHPSVHRKFGLRCGIGITDYFKGEKTLHEIVKHTDDGNLDIVTCGDRIENHSIFFTSDKFKQMLARAKEVYEFVILDCAPVKVISDYISVSALADATLLVVGNGKVSSRDVDYTVNELTSSDANVIGTIFNFADSALDKSYYYHYGYYGNNADSDSNPKK